MTIRHVVNEFKIEDKYRANFSFVNARVRRVIGYRTTTMDDGYRSKFEFLSVSHRKVVEYVVYKNYEPELFRSKFELVEVKVKTVRVS